MYLIRKLIKRKRRKLIFILSNYYRPGRYCQTQKTQTQKLLLCSCREGLTAPSLRIKGRTYRLHAYLICGLVVESIFEIGVGEQQRNILHFLITSSSTPSCLPALREGQVTLSSLSAAPVRRAAETKARLPSPTHCACISSESQTLDLSFSISYLSMKGFRMVIPNKKNIRTEKPIIVNPSSMARSSPALEGSCFCPSGGSPPLWSVFLFLPEADKVVLW